MSFLRKSPSLFLSLFKKPINFKFLTLDKTQFISSENLEVKVSNPIINEEILKNERKSQYDLEIKEILQNIKEAVKYRENMHNYESYFSENFELIEKENYQSQILVTLSLALDKSKQNKEFLLKVLASINKNVQKFDVKSLVDALYGFSQFSFLMDRIDSNIFVNITDRILNKMEELDNLDVSKMFIFLKNIKKNISNKAYHDSLFANFNNRLIIHLKNVNKLKNFDSLIAYVYTTSLDSELSRLSELILEKLTLIHESMTKNEIYSTMLYMHKIQKRLVNSNSFERFRVRFTKTYCNLYKVYLDNFLEFEDFITVTKILETEKLFLPQDLNEIGKKKFIRLERNLGTEAKYFDSVRNIYDCLKCLRFLDSNFRSISQYAFLFQNILNITSKRENISNEDLALVFEQLETFLNRGIEQVKTLVKQLSLFYLKNIDTMDKNLVILILKCCRILGRNTSDKFLEALFLKSNGFSLEQISFSLGNYMKVYREYFQKHDMMMSYLIESVDFSNVDDLKILRKLLNCLHINYAFRKENKSLEIIKMKIIGVLDDSVISGEYKKNVKVFLSLMNCFSYFGIAPSSQVASTEVVFLENFNIYIKDNLIEMVAMVGIFTKEYEKRLTNYLKPRLINFQYSEFMDIMFFLSRTQYIKSYSYVQETLFEKLKRKDISENDFLDNLHYFSFKKAGTVDFWNEVESYFLSNDKSLNILRKHYTSQQPSRILSEEETYEKAKYILEGRTKLLLVLKTFNMNNQIPVKFCHEFLPVVKKLLEESQFSIVTSMYLIECFSRAKVNDDELWYKLQELSLNSKRSLSLRQVIQILGSFGSIRKGSQNFWKTYLNFLQKNISQVAVKELFIISNFALGYVDFNFEPWKEDIKQRALNDPTGRIRQEVEMYRADFFKES